MAQRHIDPNAILFEFHQVGNAVKVTAVHPPSLTEVSIVGSASAGEAMLKRVALRKLEYVMARDRGGPTGGRGGVVT